ncbi:MAG TPA: ATP-binding protein [Kofleriaceae bacterium]|nr:ATP-binding protein [Kofleriaceae bacterium]
MEPSSRPPGKLVVAHPERKAQRALQRLVSATSCPVQSVADVDALLAAVDPDTIAVVDMTIAHATPDLCHKDARAWIAVPGEGITPADGPAVDALLAAGWWHVVAHPMPILAEELLATVQKLLRKDVFGLEKYVAWGAEVRTYTLEDARERDAAVATIAQDVTAVGLPDRIASLVSVIADELIANALYIAPLDDKKVRFRANDARERSRALRGRDVVTARWATDARYLAIEVRDRWGTLDPHRIASSLASGKSSTTASEGGMGLALAYACCNQLVVDLEPEVMTEMVALLDVRYKPTELGRSASFHTFIAAAPGES